MLRRKRDHRALFPAQCEVRGCTARPEDWFDADQRPFDVCSVHELELRAGEPHVIADGELLVGRDSTGEVVSVRRDRTSSMEAAVVGLGREGVIHQVIRLECADLAPALDALDADGSSTRD
jgi:hypothetical protein